MSFNEWVEPRTILRGVVGSTAHGLHTDDGVDDRDEMGVCLEPFDKAMGVSTFEQMIYRTAEARTGKHDAPSRAGDLDLTIYSLRKWTRLALAGNPTVILLLFLPRPLCVTRTPQGDELQALAPMFHSRLAAARFLGYLTAQKKSLLGERSKDVQRPELVAKYGYDTKYAMHMVRLGMQGVEFLATGKLTLPMPEPSRSWIRSIRVGEIPLAEVVSATEMLERELKALGDRDDIPAVPDVAHVWAWVRARYLEQWVYDAVGTTTGGLMPS